MSAADPTMDLIRSMDTDPGKWVVNTVVAFVPHERSFPARKLSDGTVVPAGTVRVSEAQLRAEADRANDRIRKTGRLDTLTIGHRNFDPGFKETDQPPLVGFCRNYSVKWVEREGGKFLALVYDEYAARDRADKHDLYRQFPFRSAEYHPDLGVAGVAALVRPPALNMGTVYVYEANPMADANPDVMSEEETRQYASFCRMMRKYTTEFGGAGPANASPPAPANPHANYQAQAVPVTTPAPAPATTPAVPVVPPPVVPLNYAADLAVLRQQLDAERAARVGAECRAMLDPFRAVLKFDYDRELAALTTCQTPEQRAAHVKYMADTYQVLPTGGMVQVYQGPVVPATPPGPGVAPANYQAVLAYMNARPGLLYDQAEAALTAGAK